MLFFGFKIVLLCICDGIVLEKGGMIEMDCVDFCVSFQVVVFDILVEKLCCVFG